MRVLARREGLFGVIRVLERKRDGARLYCIEESLQTMVHTNGVSTFGYVHAIKLLLTDARSVLLIGGAGGSLATMLARRRKKVTVIDIDPVAEELARAYFGLDECVHWNTSDPFTFIENFKGTFDAVVIDACNADGLVAPFHDPDVLSFVIERACPGGSLVINHIYVADAVSRSCLLASEMRARGLNVTLYRADNVYDGNEILHVRAVGKTDVFRIVDVNSRPPEARNYLTSLRSINS